MHGPLLCQPTCRRWSEEAVVNRNDVWVTETAKNGYLTQDPLCLVRRLQHIANPFQGHLHEECGWSYLMPL